MINSLNTTITEEKLECYIEELQEREEMGGTGACAGKVCDIFAGICAGFVCGLGCFGIHV